MLLPFKAGAQSRFAHETAIGSPTVWSSPSAARTSALPEATTRTPSREPALEPYAFASPAELLERSTSKGRFVRWLAQDAWALVRGVPSKYGLMAAGAGAGLIALSRLDGTIAEGFDPLRKVDELQYTEPLGSKSIMPAVSLTLFAGSLLTDDVRFQDAAFTAFESVLFATMITNTLKFATGRARPYQRVGHDAFHPFTSGFTSFPSGHTTTAFAFMTAWFYYYPGPHTASLVALAGGTALSRMAANKHWLTDVLAGAAVGSATSYILSRRHQREQTGLQVQAVLGTGLLGLRLTF
ncbi:MAG: hypothetical protein KatS3mg044_0824 [Rhodothermaceae bacterium]|nr:MAG: hypothetical protein KatS3mg044_0824 [Rhodothermaceae bacterium]